MAQILNTQTSTGLPICLSGITHPLALSKEMEDHDRRRKGLKKMRFLVRKRLNAVADEDFRSRVSQRSHRQDEGVSEEIIRGGEAAGDLAAAVALVLYDLSCFSLSFSRTANAA